MLKTIYKQIEKVVKSRLNKSVIQEKLSKHPNYIAKAKEVWGMINEDLGISDTVENKFISKVDKFEKALFTKFPELTKDDVIELKKSIIGEVKSGKDAVLNQVDNLKQLQDLNTKLQEANEELKNQLSKFKSLVVSDTDVLTKETSETTTTEDTK